MKLTWKKTGAIVCAAAMLFSFAGCAASGESASDAPQPSQSAGSATDYDRENAVNLVFSDDGVSIPDGSSGASADGTALTIDAAGTYVLSGSCADGSVKVKKGTAGVTLVLSGLTLASADTAAITCAKSTAVTILADAGTVNTLSDSAMNNDDEHPENENAENAVIKCKDGSQVTLCGAGTLNLTANGKNGIKSGQTTDAEGEASFTIRELTLNIDAPVNDGINAEQLLTLESGSITVAAGDDGIHCDRTLTVGADGTVGPTITITECCEGLEGADLAIRSGDITIHASDDCLNAANSDLPGYAFTLEISGGTLVMDTTEGDGIDSNGSLTITGGTVVVWTAGAADNQPLDADGEISVTGGTVLAAGGSAGMGMNLASGQTYVTFGSTGGPGGMGGSFGGFGGGQAPGAMTSDLPSGTAPTDLPTGTAPADLPSDRPELPSGAAGRGDGSQNSLPTPPDGSQSGGSGERPTPPSGGQGGASILTAGSAFTIRDVDGNTVYSGTAACNASSLFFSSDALADGGTYTLYSGEDSVGEARASRDAMSEGGPGGFGGGDGGDRPTPPDGSAGQGGPGSQDGQGDGQNGQADQNGQGSQPAAPSDAPTDGGSPAASSVPSV